LEQQFELPLLEAAEESLDLWREIGNEPETALTMLTPGMTFCVQFDVRSTQDSVHFKVKYEAKGL